jgi:TRAP-type C4-dicarboxylate transport system substrate-binding protein
VSPRVFAAAVALVVGAVACSGAGGDKAGGQAELPRTPVQPVGKPVTLTLVTVDDTWASEFATAASRLSGGSIRIHVRVGGEWLLDYERRLVDDVRAGKAELASVGARAWDRMGVTSFQGVVAPFLVDSLELQQRVLAGGRPARMLESVEPLGLVGVALLPGVLRRPLGVSRELVGPEDYAGTRFGIRLGRVAEATAKALRARPRPYRIGALGAADGAELDVATIVNNGYDKGARALTANVVLWARPETIVISRRAFLRLGPAQREVLRRAGREAAAPVRARIEREQREALAGLCQRGALRLASASPSELAALRAAVRPVYRELERDPGTRKLIAEIRRIKRGIASEPLRCRAAVIAAAAIEGRWSATATREQLLAAGAEPKEVGPGQRTATLELDRGRWVARLEPNRSWTGTYAITGERTRFILRTCSHNPCDPGATAVHEWSVYRDTLSLKPFGRSQLWQLTAAPWTRAGG